MGQVQTSDIAATQTPAERKELKLRDLMRGLKTVLVAYSGGVDSAYLAFIAKQELGVNAVCYLGLSPSVSQIQREEAEKTARQFDFNFQTINTEELADPNYQANPNNRCYFCKTELYGKLAQIAVAQNLTCVIDGTNADDVGDYRPGRAAATENNVRSPLVEINLTKNEIRELSKKHGLSTWDKPSSPCLSSRIAHGVPVTIERLSKVERGEAVLRENGFREYRVRLHDQIVRLEIAPDELERALNLEMFQMLTAQFKKLGFRYITLDMEGYRSGAMNEISVE